MTKKLVTHAPLLVPVPGPTQYVDRNVTIHEHRAPTDESVKLLKEMEEKAEIKLIEAIRLDGNGFECVIHAQKDYASDRTRFRVIFDLNGRRMVVDHDASSRETMTLDIAPKLCELVAQQIAREILRDAFTAFARKP